MKIQMKMPRGDLSCLVMCLIKGHFQNHIAVTSKFVFFSIATQTELQWWLKCKTFAPPPPLWYSFWIIDKCIKALSQCEINRMSWIYLWAINPPIAPRSQFHLFNHGPSSAKVNRTPPGWYLHCTNLCVTLILPLVILGWTSAQLQ